MYRLILSIALTAVMATALMLCMTGPAAAVVIAVDDFESYTLGTIIGQGTIGSGWASAYSGLNSTKTGSIPLRNVSSGVMAGFGQSLEIGHTAISTVESTNNNIVQRLFDPQTDTVYVGFAFKTSGFDSVGASERFVGDMFQLYVNNTSNDTGTGGSQGDSLSDGVDSAPDGGNGAYFARKGGEQTDTAFSHTNDVIHRMVMKVSKSGLQPFVNVYDQIALFVDQGTEGTPDAARAWDAITTPSFDTISRLHMRIWGLELEDRVYLDGLRIATTYAEALPEIPVVELIPGDTNGNQIVDGTDAAKVAENWGNNVGTGGYGSGDFNNDQVVDAADASIMAANWGSHVEGATGVPEPGTIALVLGLALVALPRRTRR